MCWSHRYCIRNKRPLLAFTVIYNSQTSFLHCVVSKAMRKTNAEYDNNFRNVFTENSCCFNLYIECTRTCLPSVKSSESGWTRTRGISASPYRHSRVDSSCLSGLHIVNFNKRFESLSMTINMLYITVLNLELCFINSNHQIYRKLH